MKTLKEIIETKERTFSLELFPPKTEEGYKKLLSTIEELAKLKPDFISCTYGAGGGSKGKTLDVVQHIQEIHKIVGIAHLTCVCHTKEEIKDILSDIKSRSITSILALRGDPPKDDPNWEAGDENFKFSSELCKYIRKYFGDSFTIGVAGFPEGHPSCSSKELDAKFLKGKLESGADFVITQFFFDNKHYFDYVQRLRDLNINAKIIPGILPITDFNNLLKFSSMCGASIPDSVSSVFDPIKGDKGATIKEGIKFAVKQCKELLDGGAPGIHFYALNKIHPVDSIIEQIR